MSRRLAPRRYYDYDDYYYPRRYRRDGCWNRFKRFIYGGVIAILCIIAAIVVAVLVFLATLYHAYLGLIGLILLGVAALVGAFLVLRLLVSLVTDMRLRTIAASRAKVDLSQRQIARDAYKRRVTQQLQPRPIPLEQPRPIPLEQRTPKRTIPLRPQSVVAGMPATTVVHYCDVRRYVQPGQIIALIRGDLSPRIESWDAFKTLLVLGSSSSGKTTTMSEKILGFVNGGGLIIPCDPHESKEDSLFHKIHPLASKLYPGATFASEHKAILDNILLAQAVLEDRVRGADTSVPVLLVIEELNRLLRDKAMAKQLALILEELGEEGRGFGVFALVGCQKVTGLADIRKSFISYIVHRCDETEASHVLPSRYAKLVPELKNGQCFVKDANGQTEPGLQVLVTQQDMRATVHLPRTRSTQRNQNAVPRRTVPFPLEPDQRDMPSMPRPPAPMEQPKHNPYAIPRRPPPERRQAPPSPREPSTDFSYPRRANPNPFHTWSPDQGRNDQPEEDIASLFDPAPSPPQLGPPKRIRPNPPPSSTPAKKPLSVEEQLEMLAKKRKKKN